MKSIFIIISLFVLLVSCKTESIVDPSIRGEAQGENIVVSASFGYLSSINLINEIDSTFKLLSIIGTDINYLGKGSNWIYNFVGENNYKIYSIMYKMGSDWIAMGIDSTENSQVGIGIISANWIDSDSILIIAEKNGGDNFRYENSDYKIEVSLTETSSPNSFPIWSVKYYTLGSSITFRINAINGNIYQKIFGVSIFP